MCPAVFCLSFGAGELIRGLWRGEETLPMEVVLITDQNQINDRMEANSLFVELCFEWLTLSWSDSFNYNWITIFYSNSIWICVFWGLVCWAEVVYCGVVQWFIGSEVVDWMRELFCGYYIQIRRRNYALIEQLGSILIGFELVIASGIYFGGKCCIWLNGMSEYYSSE